MKYSLLIWSCCLFLIPWLPACSAGCIHVEQYWFDCSEMSVEALSIAVNVLAEGEQIEKLTIHDCSIETLHKDMFTSESFSRTKTLELDRLGLHSIEPGTLARFIGLEQLSITNNYIETFDNNLFEDTTETLILNLQNNRIKEISNLCQKFHNLQKLILDHNPLEIISSGQLDTCSKLNELSLANTDITSFDNSILEHLPNLRRLNLTHNGLTLLENISSPNLQTIDVSFNHLTSLDTCLFHTNLTKLEKFNADKNRITNIQPCALNFSCSLYILSLSSNRISVLNKDMFKNFMPSLGQLNIADNPIEEIANGTFNKFERGLSVNFRNSLSKLPSLTADIMAGLENSNTLDLSSTGLKSISGNAFKNFRNLNQLYLQDNNITHLFNQSFAGLKELYTLNLTNNRITEIESGAFNGLTRLRNLEPRTFIVDIKELKPKTFQGVSYNYVTELAVSYLGIQELANGTFEGLYGLEILRLDGNKVSTILEDTFTGLANLKTLNISHISTLSNVQVGAFKHLPKLTTLVMSHGSVTDLHPDLFKTIYQLYFLDLSFNRITTLHPGMFTKLKSLQELHLQNNPITVIQEYTFYGLQSLRKFDIFNVPVTEIKPGAFIGLEHYSTYLSTFTAANLFNTTSLRTGMFQGLNKVRNVKLSFAGIRSIEARSFEYLTGLQKIELDNNNITIIPKSAFNVSAYNIEYLTLAHNNISVIEPGAFLEAPINILDLSYNHIGTIRKDMFIGLHDTVDLRLQHIGIQTMVYDTFSELQALQLLDIRGNRITKIEDHTFIGLRKLKLLQMSQLLVESLDKGMFHGLTELETLHITNSNVSKICHNAFNNIAQLKILHLNENLIDDIEPNAFAATNNLTILDLSYNRLQGINNQSFTGLSSLTHLNLSNNHLENISYSTFTALTVLKTLNLSKNRIKYIGIGALQSFSTLSELNLSHNTISAVETGTFSSLNSLSRLDISHNILTEVSDRIFYGLFKLESLNLSGNPIYRSATTAVLNNMSLKHISIQNTTLFCSEVIELIKYLENNDISYGPDEPSNFFKVNINGIDCINS